MALPDPLYHSMQDHFLKLHDEKTHRLWFLWPPGKHDGDPALAGKCGCVGNARFFGRNRNGVSFFIPSEEDFSNSICTAVHHICVDEDNFGYGQSLLQKNQLVFTRIPGPLFLSTPTRNFLQSQKLKDTVIDLSPGEIEQVASETSQPGTADDIVHNDKDSGTETVVIKRPEVLHLKALLHEELQTDKQPLLPESSDTTPVKSFSSPTESLVSGTSTIPTEYLPESTIPDAYDTDRYISTPSDAGLASGTSNSVPSLPEMIDFKQHQQGKVPGHERKSSYEPPNKANNGKKSPAAAVQNGLQEQGTDSKTSLKSSQHSILSHTSSLTSPVLRRFSQKEGSLVSVDSNATFTSAKEDISDTVSNLSYTELLSGRIASDPTINESRRDSSSHSADEPLWFAMDRDSTMNTVVGRSLLVHMEVDENVSSTSSSGSVASFVSAVSSQEGSKTDIRYKEMEEDPTMSSKLLPDKDDTLKARPQLQRQSKSEWSFPRVSREGESVPHTRSLPKQQSSGDDSLLDSMDLPDGPPQAGNCIDLHGQMNQPITKSPLLMSCYTNHMTKLSCSHWSAPGPHPHGYESTEQAISSRAAAGVNSYLARQTSLSSDPSRSLSWIPQFVYMREGFTPGLMVYRREPPTPPNLSSPSSATETHPQRQRFFSDSAENLKKPGMFKKNSISEMV